MWDNYEVHLFSGSTTANEVAEHQIAEQRFQIHMLIVIIDHALSALVKHIEEYLWLTSVFGIIWQLKSEEIMKKLPIILRYSE